MERRGGGETTGPARREQEGIAESLLDIADDMEEQGRDLLRQARNLQRIAERMSRRPGQARGDSSRRGESSSASRGASSRGAPRSRGGGERGADHDPSDEWQTVGSRSPRKAGGTAKPAGRSAGGGGNRSKRPQGKKKPDWVPGKKGGKKT
jgi:hypothetical protein